MKPDVENETEPAVTAPENALAVSESEAADASGVAVAPRPKKLRIVGFDIARVAAIFGMVVVNYGLVVKFDYLESDPGLNYFSGIIGIFSGRAAATFVILAGIGTGLAMASVLRSGAAGGVRALRIKLVKRALFLFVLGYSWWLLDLWAGDILHFYGLFIIAGALCLTLRSWMLWALIALLLVGSGLYLWLSGIHYWDPLIGETEYTPLYFINDLFLNGLHPFIPWFAFYLYGMWLGRQDFGNTRRLMLLAAVALAVLVAAEVIGIFVVGKFPSFDERLDLRGVWLLLSAHPQPPSPTYIAAGAATATLVILGSLWVGRHFAHLLPIKWLVQTGQMALTIYIGHILVGLYTLIAIIEIADPSDAMRQIITLSAVGAFFVFAITFSALWRRYFRRGPLEAVLRELSDNVWIRRLRF